MATLTEPLLDGALLEMDSLYGKSSLHDRSPEGASGVGGGGPRMRARGQAAKLAASPVGREPCGCETQSCKK